MNNYSDQEEEEDGFYLRKIGLVLRRKWYWFVISLGVFFAYAQLKVLVTTPIYSTQTSILLKTRDGLSTPTDLIFGNGIFSKQKTDILNEMRIIRSFPLIEQTIKELNLDIQYFREGKLRDVDLYNRAPFVVKLDTAYNKIDEAPYGITFDIDLIDEQTFSISGMLAEDDEPTTGVFKFGEPFNLGAYPFKITLNEDLEWGEETLLKSYFFQFVHPGVLTYDYQELLRIELEDEQSSVISISLDGPVPQKSVHFLVRLIDIYKKQGLDEKNQVATNTIDFIDGELVSISDSLEKAEQELALFKSENQMSEVSADAARILDSYQKLESESVAIDLNTQYFEYLENALRDSGEDGLISPSAFGVSDPFLNELTSELAGKLLYRNSLKQQDVNENEILGVLDNRINELKSNILLNLEHLKKTNQLAASDIKSRKGLIESSIRQLPISERNFIRIKREYTLSERMFLLLMEKKAEAEITRSSNTPDFKMLEEARMVSLLPIYPKKKNLYLIALLLGILVPGVFFFALEFMDDTLKSKDDLRFTFRHFFVGYVNSAENTTENGDLIREYPKSKFTESFRTVRTNLNYVGKGKNNQVFLITSLIPKEGKTFIAKNLSSSMTYGDKNSVVIGADLRKPRIHEEFNVRNSRNGLSDYLVDQVSLDQVIQPTNVPNVDLIAAGTLPPNPIELLESKRFGELIEELRKRYTYIFIDTSPLSLVSDAKHIVEYGDVILFVTRYKYTKLRLLRTLDSVVQDFSDMPLSFVINDYDSNEHSYGYYGVGNGYYVEGPSESKLRKLFKFRG